MGTLHEIRTFAKGFVPGWRIYNKYMRGADYTRIGASSFYPEVGEAAKGVLTVLSAVYAGPVPGVLAYGITSVLDGLNERDLESKKRFSNATLAYLKAHPFKL
jgi:hypothetical protein